MSTIKNKNPKTGLYARNDFFQRAPIKHIAIKPVEETLTAGFANPLDKHRIPSLRLVPRGYYKW